jgi:two-component system chemotaxis response regulator CheB
VIFLRNIIIYFDDNEKKKIVENVIKHLKDGGYLFMGHSESLSRITDKVFQVTPSIYKKGLKNTILAKMPKMTFKKVTNKVVAIGSSMGGLSVLEDILSKLEQNSPPVLIVQHMSRDILPSVIEKLSLKCKVRLKEAEDQETIEQGCVYFAPYNKHLKIKKISRGVYKTLLDDAEKISNHKPSIDVLFKSFALEVKRDAHVFILTGMGVDGVDGMKHLKASGAKTYAQDEQSSEIFGMAKVAIEAGYIDKVIASNEIPKYIL